MSAMGELTEYLCAMGVGAGCDLGETGYDRGIIGIDESRRHFSGRVDGVTFGDDEPDAAAGSLLVIRGQIGCRHSLQAAERREVRLEHHPIAQHHAADRYRFSEMGERGGSRFVGMAVGQSRRLLNFCSPERGPFREKGLLDQSLISRPSRAERANASSALIFASESEGDSGAGFLLSTASANASTTS